MERIRLYNDDCLNTFKLIEDKTIDLILIDPPYNIGKDKWDKWATVELYVEFMGKVFKECERVLKDNGSFYFFHNDFLQMVELQNYINKNTKFIFKSLITVSKSDNNYIKDLYGNAECFRNYLNINEYCLFYTFQDGKHMRGLMNEKTEVFKPIFDYFSNEQLKTGLNNKELDDVMGRKSAFSYFKKRTSHGIEFPVEKHYKKLQETGYFQKPYEKLKEEYEKIKQEYEKLRYTFNAKKGKENNLIYSFRSDKRNEHPTQKPVALLEEIIRISSNENDLVLDCFMGSGSTGVACANTNRKFIGIEKEGRYFSIAKERIEKASNISFF